MLNTLIFVFSSRNNLFNLSTPSAYPNFLLTFLAAKRDKTQSAGKSKDSKNDTPHAAFITKLMINLTLGHFFAVNTVIYDVHDWRVVIINDNHAGLLILRRVSVKILIIHIHILIIVRCLVAAGHI